MSGCFSYDSILLSGKYTYNEQLLKEVLNLLRYEKSFYTVNMNKEETNLNFNSILIEAKNETPKYYKSNYTIGLIPQELEAKINDNSVVVENLKIRNTSLYFSSNYNQAVIPCYKETENKCNEKNEFDINKDDKYKGTKLDINDNNYETYYQIDKSSESQLIYSFLQFTMNEPDDFDELSIQLFLIIVHLDNYYVILKLFELYIV